MTKPFCYVTTMGKAVRPGALEHYATKTESKQLKEDEFKGDYGASGLVEPIYSPALLVSLLEMNTYHYRACKTKARDAAGLGWVIRPLGDEEDGEDAAEAAKKTAVDDFFSDQQTPIEVTFDRAGIDYESIGYAGVELVRENYAPDGPPAILTHIPASTIRVHKSGNKFCQIRGNKKRWFKVVEYGKDVHQDTGAEHGLGTLDPEKRASELFWAVNYTPRSPYYGLSDIVPAIGALWGDLSRRDYNIAFFDNYGVPAYAVFITGNFTSDPELDEEGNETGRTELEAVIEAHFNELTKNPHSTLVLSVPSRSGDGDVKISFQALSVEVKEASFRLYRKDNRDEILAAHGTPPYRMGIAETGALGGTTASESTEIYKRSVIEPRQNAWETLLNRYIVWGAFEAYKWQFKFNEIDTRDEKHDMDMIDKLFSKAAITPNGIIRYFGERFGVKPSDDPAMDQFYLNDKPISGVSGDGLDFDAVLNSLKRELMEVAVEHAVSGENAGKSREILEIISSIKKPDPVAVED